MRKVVDVPVGMITANNQQPRKSFKEEQLMELRDSIMEFGILQPLLLKKKLNGEFMLIAGERRLRAAMMAGLDRVPAIIKEANEEEVGLIALVENIQRENLGYIEEAKAYQQLMEKYGINQVALAERLGKNQSTISNKLRILTLPEDIQNKLLENKLTERHARALLKVNSDRDRKVIIDKVVKHGFNVRQTEKLVEDYLLSMEAKAKERKKIMHISYKLYMNTFKKAYNDMGLKEKGAVFEQADEGDNMKITIIIPKGIEGMVM